MKSLRIQILLSTYNGEKYIKELMQSLLRQDLPGLEILIRDDGSNDNTLRILEQFKSLTNVHIMRGANMGAVRSFFTLLENSSPHADYIAFCDQDDVWKEGKISRAISFLDKYNGNIPAMYCSRLTLVDEDLKILGSTQIPNREITFGNALVQNVAYGCTILINNAARRLLVKNIPTSAFMHDWWTYIVVSAFGEVIYDNESWILYRQHSANLIGEKTGAFVKWMKRIRRFLKHGRIPYVTIQAKEFSKLYGSNLAFDKKAILDRFIKERGTFVNRLKYAINGETYRHTKIDDIIFRILIVINRI